MRFNRPGADEGHRPASELNQARSPGKSVPLIQIKTASAARPLLFRFQPWISHECLAAQAGDEQIGGKVPADLMH
jgi:hypothetical protein